MKKFIFFTSVIVFIFYNLQAQINLDSGLVAYYPFNGNANDESGNGNNGTVLGATLTSDRFGNVNSAYNFDGVDDYIDLGISFANLFVPFSISIWINKQDNLSQDYKAIFASNDGLTIYSGFWLYEVSNEVGIMYGDGGTPSPANRRGKGSDSTITDYTWVHIVGIVRSSTDMTIYFDAEDAGGTYRGTGGNMFNGNFPGRIGYYDLGVTAGENWKGFIDDIRIYDRALTQEEVDSLFHEPSYLQLTVSVNDGWNMVSVPGFNPNGQGVDIWWPGKDPAASVFKYSGGYIPITTATPTEGYWMKNLGAQVYNTGDEWPASGIQIVSHDSIIIHQGWNLLGVYECPIEVASITTTPSGLQEGSIYEYQGGYFVADTLYPGYGYWFKSSGEGLINMTPCSSSK